MHRPRPYVLALSLSAGVAAVAASFLVAGLGSGFVVLPVDEFLINLVPGEVIGTVILWFGSTGHLFHAIPSVLIVAAGFGALGYVGLEVALRQDSRLLASASALLTGTALAGLLTGDWTLALAPGCTLAAVVGLAPTGGTELRRVSVERRSVIRGAAGAATLLGVGGLAQFLVGSDEPPAPLPRGAADVQSMLDTAEDRSLNIEGLDGLISSSHYEVDINPISNPSISSEDWSLSITGAVENPVSLSYEQLLGMSQEHRFATLRCVSDPLNGHQMDTAVWTGVPTAQILAMAEPNGPCDCVMLRCADGYYVEVPLEPLRGGLLAYGMNGRFVPQKHGYPVRALVPGHWGETNAKWLTEIEVLEKQTDGYWESPPRNWEGTGIVTTIAKLHTARRIDSERIRIGGHAYAGTRGIERVEVSTDGGDTWMAATLSEPLPGRDTWRQWQLEYSQDGPATVLVRAVDGTGAIQPRERSEPYPRGASGWVEQEVP
jgi:DMSO/TMAO reductase YedYZ molybdopterin-dependent catalytic subunit